MNNKIEITVSEFLNRFDWSITCFEKPLYIIFESIMKNSSYIHLLLSEMEGWYFGDNFDQNFGRFFTNETGIIYEEKYGCKENFIADLFDYIEKDRYIVLIADYFRRKESESFYNKYHHMHFLALKGYDRSKGMFKIIACDNKKYDTPESYANGIDYVEHLLDEEHIKELCCFDKDCFDNYIDNNDSYKYFEVLKTSDSREYSLSRVMELFEKVLLYNIHNSQSRANTFKEAMVYQKKILRDFYQYYKSNEKSVDLANGLPIFSGQAECIRFHYNSMRRQRRFFEIKLKDSKLKSELLDMFNEHVQTYMQIINLLRRSFLADNDSGYNTINSYFDDIPVKEGKLYSFMRDNLDLLFK